MAKRTSIVTFLRREKPTRESQDKIDKIDKLIPLHPLYNKYNTIIPLYSTPATYKWLGTSSNALREAFIIPITAIWWYPVECY